MNLSVVSKKSSTISIMKSKLFRFV